MAQLMRKLQRIDEGGARLACTVGHCGHLERVVARFSSLGEHGGIWLVIGGAKAALGHSAPERERWRRATTAVGIVYVLNTALKLLIRRRRPELEGLEPLTRTPTKWSFPSAHSATSFAAARSFSSLGIPSGPLYGLAASLSLSRLYLGVHYPSDVVGGALLGRTLAAVLEPSEQ